MDHLTSFLLLENNYLPATLAMRALRLPPLKAPHLDFTKAYHPSSLAVAAPDQLRPMQKQMRRKATSNPCLEASEALDFSQVRSEKDAELLYEARESVKAEGKMTREQYGALRRKIGGTYKDFFKSYVDVEGQYVEEGWVDKTCEICKDTKGEPRQVDKLGRYVHVACLENSKSTNFFSKLFAR